MYFYYVLLTLTQFTRKLLMMHLYRGIKEIKQTAMSSPISQYSVQEQIFSFLILKQLTLFFIYLFFQWSAVYYTGGPKAESPLSQGPRPAFVKIFYTQCVHVQTHHPKSLEAYKGRVNTITITPSFTCYVFKQLIINKPAVTFQPVNNR